MSRPLKKQPSTPVSVRMNADLLKGVKDAAKIMGNEDAEVIRLAVEIGLNILHRISYDVVGLISDKIAPRIAIAKNPSDKP